MACSYADQIAAVVSLAGATFLTPEDCAPTGPVAVLQIHGTADDIVGFEGGAITDMGSGGPMATVPRRRGVRRHMGELWRLRDHVGRG